MSKFKGLRISRLSGAQNTFFLVNGFEASWSKLLHLWNDSDKIEFARFVCQELPDFKTDGVLFLKPHRPLDFAWEFYNADGSHADMCGNAARCAALFFAEKVKPQKEMKFLTGAGEIAGQVLAQNTVRIQMTEISPLQTMTVLGETGLFVNTGVPHFVIEKKPDADLARSLRTVSDFGPPGANITFVQNLTSTRVEAVTFERGVEDFTRACGTGAVASAMYLQNQFGLQNSIEVHMPGGVLKIENARPGQRPFLTGPVDYEFDMEIK